LVAFSERGGAGGSDQPARRIAHQQSRPGC
jgi:hypothetical protein